MNMQTLFMLNYEHAKATKEDYEHAKATKEDNCGRAYLS